jgi:DNA-binding beta-propeller fold protein YncE
MSMGHVDERRLGRLAEQGERTIAPAELAHLDRCDPCRELLEGHRLALALLTGPWEPRDAAPGVTSDTLVVSPSPVQRLDPRRETNGFVLPAVAAIGLVLLGAIGALLVTGRPAPSDQDGPVVVLPSPNPTLLPRATLRPGSPPVEGGMVVRVDAGSGAIRDTITLGGGPGIPTVAGGYLWTFNFGDGTVTRIDPATARVAETLQFDQGAAAILGHGDELWVTADQHDLVRLEGSTGKEIDRFELGQELLFRTGDAGFLAYAGGSIWVTVPDLTRPLDPHELWRIDPDTGDLQARLTIDRDPNPPVTLNDAIYAVSPSRNTLTRVDAATNDTTSVRVGAEPVAVAQGGGSIWVGHDRDLTIWRIDPTTLIREATIDIGEPVHSVAFGGGRLWATTWTSLHEIDPATGQVMATTRLLKVPSPRGPGGLLMLGDSVWVGVEGP